MLIKIKTSKNTVVLNTDEIVSIKVNDTAESPRVIIYMKNNKEFVFDDIEFYNELKIFLDLYNEILPVESLKTMKESLTAWRKADAAEVEAKLNLETQIKKNNVKIITERKDKNNLVIQEPVSKLSN